MTETIRKISEKVQDSLESVQDKILGAPPERASASVSADEARKAGKPERNLSVVWTGPKQVELRDMGYPKMETPWGTPIDHGVILKVVASNICGSDLHMYRGTAPGTTRGMVFGHEITGEVFEVGSGVERFQKGDLVSVPFNIGCGKCSNCDKMFSNACLRCNQDMPGAAYGYAGAGGWRGGQAEYVLVPYADYNLLSLPKEAGMEKILTMAFLSDILPTGYHGALQAKVSVGSIVYIAGAGPVGLCAAMSSFLMGASVVFVADQNAERLQLAKSIGCNVIDLTKLSGGKADAKAIKAEIEQQLPEWKNGPHDIVDASIDCVGYEGCGLGRQSTKQIDEQVINTCFTVTKAGGAIGIPGFYPMMDEGGPNADNKAGVYHLQFGACWMKGLQLGMGQCPVKAHNKELMKCILHDRIKLEQLLNVKVISLSEVPAAYERFNEGEAVKYVIDPHGMIASRGSSSKTK